MPAEKWESQHPDLKPPFTFDQMWYSAQLIALEAIDGRLRDILALLKAEKAGPKA